MLQEVLASASFPMSQFVYITYNETDFDKFGEVYNYGGGSAGYYKSNLTKNFDAHSQRWSVKLVSLYSSKGLFTFGCRVTPMPLHCGKC